MTAFAITVEVGVFSRFDSARSFASWLGLVPSEHSSGEHVSRGGITKAGNSHLRKLLLIFEVLYWTGIREGELLALTPDSFDWKKSTIAGLATVCWTVS